MRFYAQNKTGRILEKGKRGTGDAHGHSHTHLEHGESFGEFDV
jgi:hypothetical protein